jgi:prevent-host-death family protein
MAVEVSSHGDGDHWALQDAKSRFSELVRRARFFGPQHMTVHGREAAVLISTDEYRRLQGRPTGQVLIDAFRNCANRGQNLEL